MNTQKRERDIFNRLDRRYGVHAWGAAAVAAVGVVSSATKKKKKKASADEPTEAESEALKKQAGLYDSLTKIGEENWAYYKQTYRPVEEQMLATAGAGVKPDYEGITNMGAAASEELGRQYGIARGSHIRGLSRRGIGVGSTAGRSLRMSTDLAEAGGKAAAFTRANIIEANERRTERKYAEETTYNRRAAATGLGRGIATTGVSALSTAAGGMGSVAAGYGGKAADAYAREADKGKAAGDTLGSLISAGVKAYGAYQSGGAGS